MENEILRISDEVRLDRQITDDEAELALCMIATVIVGKDRVLEILKSSVQLSQIATDLNKNKARLN